MASYGRTALDVDESKVVQVAKRGSLELPKAVQGMNLLTVASGLRASVVTLGLLASK